MNTNTARTTITIKPSLLSRLRLFSSQHNRTISDIVQEGIKQVISTTERKSENMYDNLFKLKGIAKTTNPKLKDKNVDEILYGNDGVWRGK